MSAMGCIAETPGDLFENTTITTRIYDLCSPSLR